jgi:hypothetical protein
MNIYFSRMNSNAPNKAPLSTNLAVLMCLSGAIYSLNHISHSFNVANQLGRMHDRNFGSVEFKTNLNRNCLE